VNRGLKGRSAIVCASSEGIPGAAEAGLSEDAYLERLGEQTALQRVGVAEEIADAIVWLASERAS
jgi:NAD(P)-dependent dehydrogenase (short-subunit alcohol dehydrogenase family)